MKDFVGVKGVIEPQRLTELSERRNGPGLLYLASHVGVIAANTVAMTLTWGSWWCVPFFLLQGIFINFLYAPEHECDHQTAFKTRWLNVWVARICGFLIINANEDHRWGHYTHHRNTQDWEKDIELGDGPITGVWSYLWFQSGFPLIWGKGAKIVRHALTGKADDWYLTPAQARAVVRTDRWLLTGYALIVLSGVVFQSWWWLYYWFGPYALMRWSYMLEGGGEHRGLTHQRNTLLNTRTWDTNWFMRWMNWNMTYHAAHHTYPSVPFYRLPDLQKEIEDALGFELPKTSYFKLHWHYLKAYLAGKTEHDLCAEYEAPLIAAGRLPAPALEPPGSS